MAENIGQGLANLGQSIGQGLQQRNLIAAKQRQQQITNKVNVIKQKFSTHLELAKMKDAPFAFRNHHFKEMQKAMQGLTTVTPIVDKISRGETPFGDVGPGAATPKQMPIRDLDQSGEKFLSSYFAIQNNKNLDAETKTESIGLLQQAFLQEGGLSVQEFGEVQGIVSEQAKAQREATQFQQEQQFGTGTPIEFGAGLDRQLGRVTPTGQIAPITQPKATPADQAPVTVPNKELRNFIAQRSDKFVASDATKEDIKVMGKLNTIRELAAKNPSGALGTVKKMVARLTDVGRLSDFDVQFSDIDQSLKQEFMAFVAKKGKGKLSPEAVKNIVQLVDIMEGAMRRNLQAALASQVAAVSPFVQEAGIDNKTLIKMIAGPIFDKVFPSKQKLLDIQTMKKPELLKLTPEQLNTLTTEQLQIFLERTK